MADDFDDNLLVRKWMGAREAIWVEGRHLPHPVV